MELPNEFNSYLQLKIIEAEQLAQTQSITFDLFQQGKCLFLPHKNPRNYSENEVLQAIEKKKLKIVEIILNK